ncbi:MAG: class I fructose-bisphosphate aldolase, partial [Sphingomonas sp.]
GAGTFAGQIPTILKLNSSNSWATSKDQAVTGSVEDALRLGCSAIGFTIYPGAESFFDLAEEIRELRAEAASVGIATVIWSYPRGGELTKDGELALDVGAYAAHMAALLGAHIIKVKLPTAHIEQKEAQKAYEGTDWSSQATRVKHVVKSCFDGRRIVVFSGGAAKGEDQVFQDARDILAGGGNGSIIGRNTFQRPREDALAMLAKIIAIYKGEA